MVLLDNVQMNVYKLTTEQNNLTVSEFHSFRRQNGDSLHSFWYALQENQRARMSQKTQRTLDRG